MSGVATMPTCRFVADNWDGAASQSGAHGGRDSTHAYDLQHQRVRRRGTRITASPW
jgi:hypothetical protein